MKATKRQISVAMLVTVLFMLASVIVVKAAPAHADTPVRMNFFLAAIIGIFYYASMSPWFANLGFTVLYRPLVAGLLVGIVLGRPAEGVAIGANINVLYLGWISAGGSLPGDPGLAGYLGTALVLGSGLDIKAALALAAPLGLLGGLTWALRMSACSVVAHWADGFAAKGDIRGVARANYIYTQPFLFVLYAVPVALAAWLGSSAVGSALNWVGANAGWVMTGLYAASGMLAALGIGLNLKFLLRGNVWPYFFIGFMVTSLMGGSVNLLVMAIIGAAVAYIHVIFTEKPAAAGAEATAAATRVGPGLLTRNDVFRAWVRWLFFSHSAYNWERMQGLGFAHSMTPIIEKLYKSKADVTAALQRHLVFFNTQPDMGGVVHGAVIAMEEERAGGAPISDEAINSVKTGLMGPMAGIGDTVQQGIIIPIALSIGMSLAMGGQMGTATTGNVLGPILFFVLTAALIWGIGWLMWWQGYVQGRAAVTNILKSGLLNRVITGAGVLGNFVMGALAVSFVKLSMPVAFMMGGTKFELQAIFNQFMPNLLPLLLVLLVWWLLAKKNVSPTWIMVAMIVIGIVLSIPIFPGLDAKGNAIHIGLFG
jgi:mannose/fructose/N-acetylgalactosamine-specific phosphotransferase system component IID/mannose/fructose/N-acetylgalactosamine-specific phosphotransferase system component IIC